MDETADSSLKVIVGLGNPGTEYHWTRHNVGLHAVIELSQRYRLQLRSDKTLEAHAAKGRISEIPVLLATPKVFMNESGKTVGRLVRLLQNDLQSLLVIVDDIETSFGEAKLAFSGGTRGHNGLKSIKNAVGSMDFMQLRIGVGRPNHPDVAGHVLARFSEEEMHQMPEVMEKAINLIEKWLVGVR
jgi:peptidyl-tRNA hydrolase, PTH1 family